MRPPDDRLDLLQGTLDLLILRSVAGGSKHGHAIAHAIEQMSDDVLQVGHGSLYPALQRLLKRGFVAAADGLSDNNRKAAFIASRQKAAKNW